MKTFRLRPSAFVLFYRPNKDPEKKKPAESLNRWLDQKTVSPRRMTIKEGVHKTYHYQAANRKQNQSH